MLPTLMHGNTASVRAADLEPAANLFIAHARRRKTADLFDLRLSELGHAVRLAVVRSVDAAAFAVHVAHIVSMRPKEKMSRIAANRIVAAMADKHPFWDRSVRKLIGDAACSYRFIVRHTSNAVSAIIQVTEPRPALIRATLANAFPEALWRSNFDFVMAKAKLLWLALDTMVLGTCRSGKGRWLTTSTSTQPNWRDGIKLMLARIMTFDIVRRLSGCYATLRMGVFRYLGFLSTAALAESNWYIGLHVHSPFRGKYTLMLAKLQKAEPCEEM